MPITFTKSAFSAKAAAKDDMSCLFQLSASEATTVFTSSVACGDRAAALGFGGMICLLFRIVMDAVAAARAIMSG